MRRAQRLIGLVCPMLLAAGCHDLTEPSALTERPVADISPSTPNDPVLFYSTYLGGSGEDLGMAIAVDAAGNAYVTGSTLSTDFPTMSGAFQTFDVGVEDAFITKVNPTGSGLVYSTYVGGGEIDEGLAIALDALGSAYVTGRTSSTDFPTTAGTFQTTYGGGFESVFVTKVNPLGSGLIYSTYVGGSGSDRGTGIAVDALGNAYVTGKTGANAAFPTTPGAFQTTRGGGVDAFVIKLNVAATGLVYSTYVGGSGFDKGFGIALDALPIPNAYVTGYTESTNFPTLAAFQAASGGGGDAFVTKLNAAGTGLVYSTYLGGSGGDLGTGIAVDALGNAYVTGQAGSTFPITTGGPQTTFGGGGADAFVTKLNPLGSGLVYSTYLGGSGFDQGFGIALDGLPIPNAHVTGVTLSTDFPTTPGAFQTAFSGGERDAFVTKIANIVLPPGATSGKVTGGGTTNVSGSMANFGFFVQAQLSTGLVSGDLQYMNRASGAKVHSVTFATLVIAGNTAKFSGTCTKNGVPCTFTVDVTDNGEPGTNDMFTIAVDAGPPEGGKLGSGNIQIHKTP